MLKSDPGHTQEINHGAGDQTMVQSHACKCLSPYIVSLVSMLFLE